jgi:hypothetical protein
MYGSGGTGHYKPRPALSGTGYNGGSGVTPTAGSRIGAGASRVGGTSTYQSSLTNNRLS